jgi:hypothetical protein
MPELQEVDRFVLEQGKELKRRKRALRGAWLRLMAMVFAKSPKRYMDLAGEARKIINNEVRRIYDLEHPAKSKRNAKKR